MTYSARPIKRDNPGDNQGRQTWQGPKLYGAIAAGLLLAVTGGAILKLTMTDPQESASRPAPQGEVAGSPDPLNGGEANGGEALVPATGEAATPFESQPFFQASLPLRLADPSLLRSTSPQARVDAVVAGRPDPFASVMLPGPRAPRPATTATVLTPVPPSPASQGLPTVPVSATQSLPPLPQAVALPTLPAPFLPGSAPPSPTAVAVAPTGSPAFQNLVDQVVVSGVVQLGSGVSVIITEPGSTVSRRVSQGDTLAGGRIRVKSVDMSGQEPLVVLTYDGRDYTRTVGAAMVSSL
ncbi:MAG TPA: hypothetical protein VLS96_01940 [Nodosilinea sp.]|nr:hypothetical protein [Nodosilinea sp.]